MTRRIPSARTAAVLLALALLAAGPLRAAADVDPAEVRARLAERLAARGLVGLSAAVYENGVPALVEGFGIKSVAGREPVTAETMFAVGSITKQFTAACVLLLAEDGKLAVTDRVARYYPALTRAADITLLDLMNHVSGYPDYYPLDFVDRPMARPTPSDEVIRMYGTRPLDFEPGARYSYSNTGYLILGRIVEKVSGRTFGEFLKARILDPLGMAHTAYQPDPESPGCARGHMTFWLGPPAVVPLEGEGWVAGAGALFSTPADLAAWDLALIDGKVLKPGSFKLMTSPRRLNDGTVSNYGCGLAMGERGGVRFLSHSGAVNGFNAQNIVVPSTRSAAILFSNLSSFSDTNAVYAELTSLILPKPAAPDAAPAAAAPAKPKPATPAPGTPAVAGPAAAEQARAFFTALQAGRVDRKALGAEFDFFIKKDVVAPAAARMKAFGAPVNAVAESIGERGGMEVSTTRLEFAAGATLKVLMYRTPDGKIQQIFIQKGSL